jgi:hypothetical protein
MKAIPRVLSPEEAKQWGLPEMIPIFPPDEILAIEAMWSKYDLQQMARDYFLSPVGGKDILIQKLIYIGALDEKGVATGMPAAEEPAAVPYVIGDPKKFCCRRCGACAPEELLKEGRFFDRMAWLRRHYQEKHPGVWGKGGTSYAPAVVEVEKFYLVSTEEKLAIPRPFLSAPQAYNYAKEHDLIRRGYTGWRGSDVIRMLGKGTIKKSTDAVPQTITSDRGGDGDFGVPIWFESAGDNWLRYREVFAGDKIVTISVSPIKGLKRSLLEKSFNASQVEIVNFTPNQDLPYAGAAKGKLWFMATIEGKAVTVTITSIRDLSERQLEDAFNSAVASITTGTLGRKTPQELVPKEIRKRLPPLGATENIKDPIVQVKLFAPWTNWTWYATEFDGADTFFGWVVGFEKELGYFSLSELETVRGPMGLFIERDIHFEPKPLSQVMKEYGASLPMTIKSGRRIHFER